MKLVYDSDKENHGSAVREFVDEMLQYREMHRELYKTTFDIGVVDYMEARIYGGHGTEMFVDDLKARINEKVGAFTEGRVHYADMERAKAYFGAINKAVVLGSRLHNDLVNEALGAYSANVLDGE